MVVSAIKLEDVCISRFMYSVEYSLFLYYSGSSLGKSQSTSLVSEQQVSSWYWQCWIGKSWTSVFCLPWEITGGLCKEPSDSLFFRLIFFGITEKRETYWSETDISWRKCLQVVSNYGDMFPVLFIIIWKIHLMANFLQKA